MNKILEFIKSHKYAIFWTIGYLAITWAILYFLFDFSIFSSSQWRHLMRAQLLGFPGFVFGILILAALPMYIATTILIVRTKKPLITIPIPKIKMPSFLKSRPAPPPPAPEPESETPTLGPDEADTPIDLPDDIPAELRFAFIRARNNIGRIQTSAFNSPQSNAVTGTPSTSVIDETSFPLPTDFDIETPSMDSDSDLVPTFTEISFDEPEPNPSIDTQTETNDNSELIKYLTENKNAYSTDGDIVLTDTHAIITHSDPDFWVADTDNWFAAGRVCPSPITVIQNAAAKHKRTPAIYLASKNIMDIDKMISEWRSIGITVITDLSQI